MYTFNSHIFINGSQETKTTVAQIKSRHKSAGGVKQLQTLIDLVSDHVGQFDFSNDTAFYLASCVEEVGECSRAVPNNPESQDQFQRQVLRLLGVINKEIAYCKDQVELSKRDAVELDISRLERTRLRLCQVNELAGSTAKLAGAYFGPQSPQYLDQLKEWLTISQKLQNYGAQYETYLGRNIETKVEVNKLLARSLPIVLEELASIAIPKLLQLTQQQINTHGWGRGSGEITEIFEAIVKPDAKTPSLLLAEDTIKFRLSAFNTSEVELDDPTPRARNSGELVKLVVKTLLSRVPKKHLREGSLNRGSEIRPQIEVLMPFQSWDKERWAKLRFYPGFVVEQKKLRN